MSERLPHGKPVCPNHGAPLGGLPFPMTKKGIGKCPVSGVDFEYEIDLDEASMIESKDKDGNVIMTPVWKLSGEE